MHICFGVLAPHDRGFSTVTFSRQLQHTFSYNIGERLKLVREKWQICDWESVLEIKCKTCPEVYKKLGEPDSFHHTMPPTKRPRSTTGRPAARDIKLDQQCHERHQRWHLPDALKGSNQFLTDRVDGKFWS